MADKLIIAHTPEEAASVKTGDNTYLAGGTEALRLGSDYAKSTYVSIRRTDYMRTVSAVSDGLEIGASLTFQELIEHPDIPDYLKEALHFMASRTRRNMATIGGNIAACRDDSFLIPTLLAASAKINLLDVQDSRTAVLLEEYVFGRDNYSDSLILSVVVPTDISVKSVRSANTAQSHARLTSSLSCKDGKYQAYAAIKKCGLVKLDELASEFEKSTDLSEKTITKFIQNDSKIKLEDDMLYGSAEYRKYLLGISFAKMYAELNKKGGLA